MVKEQFNTCIRQLETEFDKSVNRRKLESWWNKFRDVNPHIFQAAVDRIIENAERFPHQSNLWAAINNIKSRQLQKETTAEHLRRIQEDYFANPPNPEYERDALDTLNMIMQNGPILQLMDAMETKWPGRGWEEHKNLYLDRTSKSRNPENGVVSEDRNTLIL